MELKEGYKQTEIGVIPKNWEVKELDALLKFGSGQDYKHLSKGTIPVYGTGGIMTFVDGFLYEGDSVGIGRKGTIDKPVFLSGKFWTVDTLFYTHSFVQTTARYVYYKFLTIKWKDYNEASGVPSLNKNNLEKIKISLPPLPEQKVISQVLSDTDNLIQAIEQKLSKKRDIKQGAMQKLLTPKEDWEVKELGEITHIKTGSKNNQDKIRDGQYPFFVRSQTIERINSYSFDCEAILIPGEGGIGSIYHYITGKFDVHQRVYKISEFAKDISGKFIYLYMMKNFNSHAMKNSVKATVDSLRLPTFLEFEVFLPKFEEQTKIATILSDMDAEIAQLEQKLSKYKMVKQGLMQNLLTGKIRLV